MKRIWLVGLLAAQVGAAQAGTLTYTGYALEGGNVTIADPALGVNEYGGTGLITLTTPGGPLDTLCVDVQDWLAQSGSYAVQAPAAILSANDPTFSADAANLLVRAQQINTAEAYEAAQDAVWSLEYGSAITITPDDPAVVALTQQDIAWALAEGRGYDPSYFSVELYSGPAGSASTQTLIYADPPTTVPEPGSVALLGAALLGLAFVTRRQAVFAATA